MSAPLGVRFHLSLHDVLAMQASMAMRYGWTPGLRHSAALEATLAGLKDMPPDDLPAQAAALLAGLFNAQPFREGNLAVALAATDVFLRINDAVLAVAPTQLKAELAMLGRPGGASPERVEAWLRTRVAGAVRAR